MLNSFASLKGSKNVSLMYKSLLMSSDRLRKFGTKENFKLLALRVESRSLTRGSYLGPVHTNPFSNENLAVLLRIPLSSTQQRRKRSPKTEPFENALQSGAI